MKKLLFLLACGGALVLATGAYATGPNAQQTCPINLVIQSWVSLSPMSPATITITNGGTSGSATVPFTFSSNNTGTITATVASNVSGTHSNWTFTVSGLAPTSFTPGGSQAGSFQVNINGVKLTDQASTYDDVATATVTVTNAS